MGQRGLHMSRRRCIQRQAGGPIRTQSPPRSQEVAAMPELTSHIARADAARAKEIAGTDSPFTIEVRFLGGLTQTQQAAFAAAADRWATVIVGDLPDVTLNIAALRIDGL